MRQFFLLGLLTLLFPLALSAQNITVKGTVFDANSNEPLIGVTIVQNGTQNGTITDIDGNYSISCPSDASLTFSYIGYMAQTVAVNGQTTLPIFLQTDDKTLDEIVVVGYGTQRKSDLTGSVASVAEDDLQNRSTTDAAAALQGKVTGVQILNNSGAPGEAAKIRVRGYSSNSGEIGPLLIVDGLKVDNIQYLDPSMIQSMEVLKDAASAAIYGAQAGNGVILITTKNGSKGTASIKYEGKFTYQTLGKKAEIFDAPKYIEYQKALGQMTDATLKDINYDGGNYDWFDAVFEPSWAQQHSLTMQGGNDNGHYLAGINYVWNDGIFVGNKDTYLRITGQINADYNIKKWLNVSTNNSIEKWGRKSVSGAAYGSALNSVMSIDPLTPAHYSDIAGCESGMQKAYLEGKNVPRDPFHNNDFYGTSKYLQEATGNPLFQRDRSDATSGGYNVRGMSSLNFKPVDGLVITSRFGYRITQSNSHTYTPPFWITSMSSSTNYTLESRVNTGFYYQFENFINYNKTFANKHTLGLMVGMAYEENSTDNARIQSEGKNILSDYAPNFRYVNYLLSTASKTVENLPGYNANMSYFGRLTYSYDNRYSVQFNFRTDAFDATKLNKDVRWGSFPSFSAGWTVSNENFIKDNISTEVLSFLKLRGSWGRNGNVNVLRDYPYKSTIALNAQWYQYDSKDPANVTTGSVPGDRAPNPDLTWETSEQIDLGLDARFLNSRLTLGLDWYKKTTKDLLVSVEPIPETGYKSTYINAGKVENKGLEIELGWHDKIGDFNYSVNFNHSTLKNEVKEMPAELDHLEGTHGGVSGLNYQVWTRFAEGNPIWYFYGYKYAGVDSQTGAPLFYDKDGKVTKEPQDTDMGYIGSAIPKGTYGVTVNLEYKGFDFTVYGTGVYGNDIFSLLASADRPRTNTLTVFYDDSWKNPGDNAKYPEIKQAMAGPQAWKFLSTEASIFSGAYFKFKQIQLGYTIPKHITEKAFISNFRMYVSLDDFFTITKYPGCDPETATTTNQQDMGYDAGTYPTTKKVIFGVSVTF